MFADLNYPVLPGFPAIVSRGLMETPEGQKKYVARFREMMKTVYKPDELVRRLDEAEKRVQPALATVDKGAADGLKGQVDRLRTAVRQRAKNVEEQLKKLPQ